MSAGPPPVVLASASPRRRELLRALLTDFDIDPPEIPEPNDGDVATLAARLALAKAREVAARHAGKVVIGSDTVVAMDGVSLGKPEDPADAARILGELAGRRHTVFTAVAVVWPGGEAAETSEVGVTMARLSRGAIDEYVASGRPMDKAGSYAIQDDDVPTVECYSGCYCAVMGLPLWRTQRLLAETGVVVAAPGSAFRRCERCPDRFGGVAQEASRLV